MSLINNALKKILVCPLDKGGLEEKTDKTSLCCSVCGRMYQVRDSIPVMLPEQKSDRKQGNPERSGGKSDGKRR